MSYTIPTNLNDLQQVQIDWLKVNSINGVGVNDIIYLWKPNGNLVIQHNTSGIGTSILYGYALYIEANGNIGSIDTNGVDLTSSSTYVYQYNVNGTNVVSINNTSGGEIIYPPQPNIILEDNPLQLTVSNDIELQANFISSLYHVDIDYNHSLGLCTYRWLSETSVRLTATIVGEARFIGWYVDSQLVSTDQVFETIITQDTTFEARFKPILHCVFCRR